MLYGCASLVNKTSSLVLATSILTDTHQHRKDEAVMSPESCYSCKLFSGKFLLRKISRPISKWLHAGFKSHSIHPT